MIKNKEQSAKNKSKKGREYYVLAGERKIMKVLIEMGIEVSPIYFMVVKEYSKLGKLIKKEAKKRVNEIKQKSNIDGKIKSIKKIIEDIRADPEAMKKVRGLVKSK